MSTHTTSRHSARKKRAIRRSPITAVGLDIDPFAPACGQGLPRALARKRLERTLGVPVAERTLAGWPIRYVIIGRLAIYRDHALDAFAEQKKRNGEARIGHASARVVLTD